ncbi:MAG: hypothetical protein ACLQPD_19710 [Desulfomonilaceae bacterium]
MSRPKMLCPFSKQLCRECPIYRGRHLNICSAPKDVCGSGGSRKTAGCRLGSRADDFEEWKALKQPGIPGSPKLLANIEDYVE